MNKNYNIHYGNYPFGYGNMSIMILGSTISGIVKSSLDGKKIFICGDDFARFNSKFSSISQIYIPRFDPPGVTVSPSNFACSSDFTKITVIGFSTNILCTSTDSGATWTLRDSGNSRRWTDVVCSEDFSTQVASVYQGYLYNSVDYGVTWTQRHVSKSWYFLCSNSDCSRVLSTETNSGSDVHISTDSGENWSALGLNVSNRYYMKVFSTTDGSILIANYTEDVFASQKFIISTNYGSTWNNVTDKGFVVGINSNASKIFLCKNNCLCISTDGLATTSIIKKYNDFNTSLNSWQVPFSCINDGEKIIFFPRPSAYVNLVNKVHRYSIGFTPNTFLDNGMDL